MTQPKLVIVGSIGIDHIETPREKRENLLGGSASYACAAASFFTPPGMVGVVGDDFPAAFLDLYRKFSVDLAGLQQRKGRTFAWSGVYEENMDNRSTLETVLGVFETFQPDLPEAYVEAPYVFLGNMAPDLQLHVLNQMKAPAFVLADTMDLWINIARDKLVEVIGRVHMLTLNESEARLLTGAHNLLAAAGALLAMGPEYVLIKKGEHGSMLISRAGIYIQPAFPLASFEDPTGAGDTFAGALMGRIAENGAHDASAIRHAMVHGSVVASFGVESFSLDRLAALSRDEVDARVTELMDMTRV
ncbi:MAG: bifunctional hydroxymethylpyrimidine kinase/phosphomethylpyrimidine kinase [Verrucomicrobia bacterium]|nr:bifunctional hydroxymethylpyrimidine kinase/phosphomethylpyrimidine kinase [Verrucomicrobiota bacterium]MCH8528599.1 PfkB family carbohydrate kinase [Kiritimatiellia bacterium]